ncbi:MAG: hypothetical protein AAGA30_03945 [Planctomycetota bacterium]
MRIPFVTLFVLGILPTGVMAQRPDEIDTEQGMFGIVRKTLESVDSFVGRTESPHELNGDFREYGPRSERNFGPPPWVAVRINFLKSLGLPGPPAEVVEAWENGYGFDLPGPPQFILEFLSMFDR